MSYSTQLSRVAFVLIIYPGGHILVTGIYRLLPLVLVLNIVFAAVAYVRCEKLRLVGISILITGLDLLLGGTVVFAVGYGIHYLFNL